MSNMLRETGHYRPKPKEVAIFLLPKPLVLAYVAAAEAPQSCCFVWNPQNLDRSCRIWIKY